MEKKPSEWSPLKWIDSTCSHFRPFNLKRMHFSQIFPFILSSKLYPCSGGKLREKGFKRIERLWMSGCQALHYTLKILLKIRGSLNVLQDLEKSGLSVHQRQGFWQQNKNFLWVFPFLGRNLINSIFLMTTLTLNALVSMKNASSNSSYVWIFNYKGLDLLQLTMHFCTVLKICHTV